MERRFLPKKYTQQFDQVIESTSIDYNLQSNKIALLELITIIITKRPIPEHKEYRDVSKFSI